MPYYKNLIKNSFIVTVACLLVSCKSSQLCKEDLIAFLNNPENELIQTKETNREIILKMKYRPSELLFQHDTVFLAHQSDFLWFKFSIEFVGDNSVNFLQASKLLSESAIESAQWFEAEVEGNAVSLADVQAVSYLGTASKMDYLIAISKEMLNGKELSFYVAPHVSNLTFLTSDYHFDIEKITNTPNLKLNC